MRYHQVAMINRIPVGFPNEKIYIVPSLISFKGFHILSCQILQISLIVIGILCDIPTQSSVQLWSRHIMHWYHIFLQKVWHHFSCSTFKSTLNIFPHFFPKFAQTVSDFQLSFHRLSVKFTTGLTGPFLHICFVLSPISSLLQPPTGSPPWFPCVWLHPSSHELWQPSISLVKKSYTPTPWVCACYVSLW